MKVYKSIILPIKTTQSNLDYLYQCNKESARVWNECIRLNKELWEKYKIHVNGCYLQKNINGSFSGVLYAKSIQNTIRRYMANLVGVSKSNKQGRKDVTYPYKIKKNYNTMWDVQCLKIDYDKNIIRIPRPRVYYIINTNGKRKENPIYLKFKMSLPQNITQIELVYNNGLKLAINYWVNEENLQIVSNNTCAVDLGEIHSITTVDTNGNSEIITGRKIRSFQRFRNKELGKLQRKLRKCKKDSKNYKKYRKAIRKLMSKSTNKMRDGINKTSKLFSNFVIENDINTIVVGDLSKFNMNLRKHKEGNQQKTVQWTHGQMLKKIKHNLEKHNVVVEEISEAYTSQTCPNCGNKHKPTGRNYVCKCGFTMHRDIVGAINILSKYLNDGKIKTSNLLIKPIKYLRIT